MRYFRAEVEQKLYLLGKALQDDELVFSHVDGRPLDPSTVTHVFKQVIRKSGLSNIRLHDLRHSYTSLMLAAGADIKQISSNLGHSNIGITFDIYSHLLSGAGKTAAERFDKFLKPWLDESEGVGNLLAKDGDPDARPEGFEPSTLGSEDRCSVR